MATGDTNSMEVDSNQYVYCINHLSLIQIRNTDRTDIEQTEADKKKKEEENIKDNDTNDKDEKPKDTQPDPNGNANDITKAEAKVAKRGKMDRLKLIIAYNRKIVTKGCGNRLCTNPYCKSNRVNKYKLYTDSEASKLALKMTKSKHKKCAEFPDRIVKPLTLKNLQLIEEKEDKQVYDEIVEAFAHWDIFYDSFLTANNTKVSENDAQIDWVELDRTFNLILKHVTFCYPCIY